MFFVKMQDGFCIAVRLINVTPGFERLAIIGVVVDLAVVRHPHGAVFIRKRLMSAGEIDDAQTTVREDAVRIGVETGAVRAAVRDDVPHSKRRLDIVGTESVGGDYSGNAAHGHSVEQAECHEIARKRLIRRLIC